jgi:hypothetical protein
MAVFGLRLLCQSLGMFLTRDPMEAALNHLMSHNGYNF